MTVEHLRKKTALRNMRLMASETVCYFLKINVSLISCENPA